MIHSPEPSAKVNSPDQVRAIVEQLTLENDELRQLNALLSRSNQDLERFAFAASQDLQEPLRGITDDADTIDALQFLMTREITHMKAFTAALESLGKDRYSMGSIPPTAESVDQYFDDSTGLGDRGEPNARGPWNEGGDWELVETPAFREVKSDEKGTGLPGYGAATQTKRAVTSKSR